MSDVVDWWQCWSMKSTIGRPIVETIHILPISPNVPIVYNFLQLDEGEANSIDSVPHNNILVPRLGHVIWSIVQLNVMR